MTNPQTTYQKTLKDHEDYDLWIRTLKTLHEAMGSRCHLVLQIFSNLAFLRDAKKSHRPEYRKACIHAIRQTATEYRELKP